MQQQGPFLPRIGVLELEVCWSFWDCPSECDALPHLVSSGHLTEQYDESCDLSLSVGVQEICSFGRLHDHSHIAGHDLVVLQSQNRETMTHLMTSPVEHQAMPDASRNLAIFQLACVLLQGESQAEFGKLA